MVFNELRMLLFSNRVLEISGRHTFTIIAPFWGGFTHWLTSLTTLDFILIFWLFIVVDLTRSIGKPLLLAAHSIHLKFKPKKQTQPTCNPKISIIIPAYNEENAIVKSIESALKAEYDNKEIIVVDDGSQDRTYLLANFFAADGRIKLVRREYSSGSKAGALNYGVLFASGEVLVTVDADTLIEKNALKEIVKTLNNPDVVAASGKVSILSGENGSRNLLVRLQDYEYFLAFEVGRPFSSVMGTLMIISGAFGAFRGKEIEDLGKYDKDTITEDFDLTIKLRKLGKKIVYTKKAVAWTLAPYTWKSWRKQRIRWTKGEVETLWKHRNILKRRGFDLRSVISTWDMLFIDVILLMLRAIWLVSLIYFFTSSIVYVLFLSLIGYFVLEMFAVAFAVGHSRRLYDLRHLLLVPVMVLVYRPYYALIRLRAYFDWVFKKKREW